MESKVHQMFWFHSKVIFLESFQIFSTLRKSRPPPLKLKSPPNLVSRKIAPIAHKIGPWGAISPTLKTMGLTYGGL